MSTFDVKLGSYSYLLKILILTIAVCEFRRGFAFQCFHYNSMYYNWGKPECAPHLSYCWNKSSVCTHTHTHIYIHIYIYILWVGCSYAQRSYAHAQRSLSSGLPPHEYYMILPALQISVASEHKVSTVFSCIISHVTSLSFCKKGPEKPREFPRYMTNNTRVKACHISFACCIFYLTV